eukprot:6235897-Amphidinium_carterae.1
MSEVAITPVSFFMIFMIIFYNGQCYERRYLAATGPVTLKVTDFACASHSFLQLGRGQCQANGSI